MTQNIQLHTICPKLYLKVSLLSCLISIVVVHATVRLGTCSLAWSAVTALVRIWAVARN